MGDNVDRFEIFAVAHSARNHLCSGQLDAQEHREHFGTQSSNECRNVHHGRIDKSNLENIAHGPVHSASSRGKGYNVIRRWNRWLHRLAAFPKGKHCHAATCRGPLTEETAVPAAPSIDVVAAS